MTHTGSVTSSSRTANDDGAGTGEDLRRSAHGDREAFARVYDRTVARVYGLALRMLRDPVRAQEVTRETYLDAWSQAHRYDPTEGSASAWITGLAHRRAVARVRAVGGRTLSDATAEPTGETSPDARAAWSALSAQEARALDLTYLRRCQLPGGGRAPRRAPRHGHEPASAGTPASPGLAAPAA